jgi:hypothetical protein
MIFFDGIGFFTVAVESGRFAAAARNTPVVAVKSIETWWKQVGEQRYRDTREIYITADAGGSNGHRARLRKAELQRLADEIHIAIYVSHFLPGTASGTRSSTACSRSSRSTGVADHCGPTRRSST